jgi:hypothetical protein
MSGGLKLLIFRDAQNSKNAEIAPNWNVSGTREVRAVIYKQLASVYDNVLDVACYGIWSHQIGAPAGR